MYQRRDTQQLCRLRDDKTISGEHSPDTGLQKKSYLINYAQVSLCCFHVDRCFPRCRRPRKLPVTVNFLRIKLPLTLETGVWGLPALPPGPCSLSPCHHTQHLKRTSGPRRATVGQPRALGPRKERSEKRRELGCAQGASLDSEFPSEPYKAGRGRLPPSGSTGGGRLPPSGSTSERLAARNRPRARARGWGPCATPGRAWLPSWTFHAAQAGASVSPAPPTRRRGPSAREDAAPLLGGGPGGPSRAPRPRGVPRLSSSSRPPHPASGPLCARMWASLPGRPSLPTPPPTSGPAPIREPGPRGKDPRGPWRENGWEGIRGLKGRRVRRAQNSFPGTPMWGWRMWGDRGSGGPRRPWGRRGLPAGPPPPEAAPGVGSAEVHARSEGLGGQKRPPPSPHERRRRAPKACWDLPPSHTSPQCKEVLSWSRLPCQDTDLDLGLWVPESTRPGPDGLGGARRPWRPRPQQSSLPAAAGGWRSGGSTARPPWVPNSRHHRRQNHSRRG